MAQRTITADARTLAVEPDDEKQIVKVEFYGAVSGTATALKISGDNTGARLTIDIPETEILAALKLTALRSLPLKFTVELPEPDEVNKHFKK